MRLPCVVGLENFTARFKRCVSILDVYGVAVLSRVYIIIIAQNDEYLVVAQQIDDSPLQRTRRSFDHQHAFEDMRATVCKIANLQSPDETTRTLLMSPMQIIWQASYCIE